MFAVKIIKSMNFRLIIIKMEQLIIKMAQLIIKTKKYFILLKN